MGQLPKYVQVVIPHPEFFQVQGQIAAIQHPHYNAFSEQGRQYRYPQIEVFLPQTNKEFLVEVNNLLVIGEDGIKQVDRYELHLLRERPGQPHPLIGTFSLAD